MNKNFLNSNKNKKSANKNKKNEELDYLKTPIKKNYRDNNNYEIKNNFSTEAYTELYNSIDQNSINKKKFLSNKKNFWKKLNLEFSVEKNNNENNDKNENENNNENNENNENKEDENYFNNDLNKKRKIK